ncbi:shikimate O-hydroxycinnamoyltransferase isoform X2 [Beta vulgaris subsp. vulgaris]|uniref:shikimate O-hydroxycinnamoyltransferase isoform X2 n=1 Tax=Beta vulgaris subsp. vulgaris TaxID=3555 RepID=UPI0005400C7C|nr:shikimate O-hydroxycinnamoyltransferase isoform X2 [Beta vulgaris subsp. vulgaris]
MSIHVKESIMVFPAKETPKKTLWLSSIDLVRPSPYAHLPFIYIYTPKNEEQKNSKFVNSQVLRESLSRVLVPFYPVAGRLKKNNINNRIEIDCNAAGALFIDAETPHFLGDFGGFEPPSVELRKLVMPPPCDYSAGLSLFPLLMVQLTRFECGSVCICFAVHHHVADGIGHLYFINSWARLAKGLQLDVQPFHDRALHLAPRKPPQVKFQHLEYEPPSPHKGEMATARECVFKLYKDQINTLRSEATTSVPVEEENYKLSTYEVLAGHVWRSACKARDLTGDEIVKLYIPTDGRSRLKDPNLPQGYFGNVLFFTTCSAKACDIMRKPLSYAASKVHEALQKVENEEYLRSAIDYLELQSDITTSARGALSVTCPNLSINSWGRLPLYEADFGWGKPEFVGRGGIRFEGEAYFVPSPNREGNFSLNIKLFTIHIPLFEKYLYDV